MGKLRWAFVWVFSATSCLFIAACGGGSNGGTTPPVTFTLTVNSSNPASGVAIGVSPADKNGAGNGSTSFSRTYASGTAVKLSAPASSSNNHFSQWSGCTSSATVTCNVTLNANIAVTAAYAAGSGITSVTVSPNPATSIIGTTTQFSAVVNGTGSFSSGVTWSVAGPAGSTLSPGDISSTGLYTTPYPAPSTVTVTATSTQDASVSGSVVVTLSQPAAAAGPALTVDAGNQTHAINPYIYGMNGYTLSASVAKAGNIGIVRWGGDSTSRYNYQLNATNDAIDYYFENEPGVYDLGPTGLFNDLVTSDSSMGIATLGTVPVIGWVAKDSTSCSYPTSTYPHQVSVDASRGCGNGVYPNGVNGCTNASGCNITGVSASATSTPAGPSFAGSWVASLVSTFGTAANGGVAVYDLDNEPSWWDGVHRDVHPAPFTYDEVTNNGIATAQAVKAADPTAAVSGPVIDYWWAYFYSKKDIEAGWSTGPCYQPWSDPADRTAHGGTPMIEYYLKQFAAYDAAHTQRLLDYLDLHTYFAADNLAFSTAGDTSVQQARLNSTRVFWDPTYTDPNYPQPNYTTDANYTANCSTPLQAPQVIPMMHNWVNADYPGTKLAITEYNWGGLESINGAIAQADILGIFGREGLDLGALWGPPDPTTQVPGLMAFEAYRNYDGANSTFGNEALAATSADQSKLAVYGALRTKDSAVTLVVVNKTYGDLTTTLSLANLTPNGAAKVWNYSAANLSAIVAKPDLTVTPPSSSGTTSMLTTTFPAQSITILVIPKL
ncbi:MAG TPA: glycoside hydrolase family 44 protein [Terracidiphilus sp.]|jgi:hypothetical protein|nr:glycoside hydrolase family 44 protein [Terracidiphilus sp.]